MEEAGCAQRWERVSSICPGSDTACTRSFSCPSWDQKHTVWGTAEGHLQIYPGAIRAAPALSPALQLAAGPPEDPPASLSLLLLSTPQERAAGTLQASIRALQEAMETLQEGGRAPGVSVPPGVSAA